MTDSPRERLRDALVTIIAERGLDRVSIREVAALAGVSIGTVQYYCRSKDEMLRTAFEHIIQRILERMTGIAKTGAVGNVLRRSLLESLPLDDARGIEARVYLAFAARAAVSADLARVQHTLMSELREMCVRAFRLAQDRGQARADLVPEVAAAATVAMLDGLLLHLLTDPTGLPADVAVAALDAHLRQHLDLDDAPSTAGDQA